MIKNELKRDNISLNLYHDCISKNTLTKKNKENISQKSIQKINYNLIDLYNAISLQFHRGTRTPVTTDVFVYSRIFSHFNSQYIFNSNVINSFTYTKKRVLLTFNMLHRPEANVIGLFVLIPFIVLTVIYGIYFNPNLDVLSYGASNLTSCSESTDNTLLFLPFNSLVHKLSRLVLQVKSSYLFNTLKLRFKSYAFNYIVLKLIPKWIVPSRYINLYLRSIHIITEILEKRDLCSGLMGKRLNHSQYYELINYIANIKFLNYIFISICLISMTLFPGYMPEWAISFAINSIYGEILYFLLNSYYRNRDLNFKYLFIFVIVSSYLIFALNVNYICIFTNLIMIFTLIIGIFIVIYILLYINLIDKEFKNNHPFWYYVNNILGILLLFYLFVVLIDQIKEFIFYTNKSSGSKRGISGKGVGNTSSSDRGGNPNPGGGNPRGPNPGGTPGGPGDTESKKRKRGGQSEEPVVRKSARVQEKSKTGGPANQEPGAGEQNKGDWVIDPILQGENPSGIGSNVTNPESSKDSGTKSKKKIRSGPGLKYKTQEEYNESRRNRILWGPNLKYKTKEEYNESQRNRIRWGPDLKYKTKEEYDESKRNRRLWGSDLKYKTKEEYDESQRNRRLWGSDLKYKTREEFNESRRNSRRWGSDLKYKTKEEYLESVKESYLTRKACETEKEKQDRRQNDRFVYAQKTGKIRDKESLLEWIKNDNLKHGRASEEKRNK